MSYGRSRERSDERVSHREEKVIPSSTLKHDLHLFRHISQTQSSAQIRFLTQQRHRFEDSVTLLHLGWR